MEIKFNRITIDEKAISPTLIIRLYLEFVGSIEAPISISGRLLSADNKVLSLLNEYHIDNESRNFGLELLTKDERNKIGREKRDESYSAEMTATLSPKAIEHIELLREKDYEKSVRFEMDFVVKYIEIDMSATPQEKTSDFLRVHVEKYRLRHSIKQSDWVQNYSPLLGIGNFLLLELTIPNKHKVTEEWKDLYDRASLRLTEMNEAIRAGDWQKAMDRGRQFYDSLKIGDKKPGHEKFEAELRKLFEADQHSPEGIQNLFDGIWKFFEYNSKFVHDKDKSGNLNPIPVTTKEDAYFIYAIGIGLLNIIGKKISHD